MKKLLFSYTTLLITILLVNVSIAQVSTVDSLDQQYLNWYNLSPANDSIMGVDTETAYATFLKDKKTKKTIIVAVIDGGVDVYHEDLQGQIWKNEDEIEGNGIDDDKNGYIDDIYGWNFLGNANGENVDGCNLEMTRLVRRYKSKYEGKTVKDVPKEEKETFLMYQEAQKQYDENKQQYEPIATMYKSMYEQMVNAEKAVNEYLKKSDYTLDELKAIETEDEELKKSVEVLIGFEEKGISKGRLEGIVHYVGSYMDYYLNLDYDARSSIIKDKPFDMNDAFYGNPDVKGPDASHGTMVSGIIAGTRNNGVGVNGIATDVKIMALRTVPNGDENDKDVALSIRYAVDNGAHIINMSFGKGFSPMEKEVNDAVKYAESKGVLMVKASGNDGANVDIVDRYPSAFNGKKSYVDSWLTVGANNRFHDKTMPATFSNYGKKKVDIFAPGVDMIMATPDNTYQKANGTSFACPTVTGVATLVWSYYPELTALELKDVLMKSAISYKKDMVNQPTEGDGVEVVKFGQLSISGAVVNALNALKMAEEVVAKKK